MYVANGILKQSSRPSSIYHLIYGDIYGGFVSYEDNTEEQSKHVINPYLKPILFL